MSQAGKILPNLDHNGTKILNLTVLQRIDPTIQEILMTAAHVAIYEFDIDSNQWSRKDVEGSLFVVKRTAQPRFQFIVMNRRNAENLVENISADFEYELQVPYLLYRNAVQEVNGIWFYNSRECDEVTNLFDRIQNDYLKAPSELQVSSSKSEFQEFEEVPVASFGGPLEPLSTNRNMSDFVEDASFTNFFNAAANLGNNASTTSKPDSLQHSAMYPSISSDAARLHQPNVPSMRLQPTSNITSSPSIPLVHHYDAPTETMRKPNQIADLLKPSAFYKPPSPAPPSAAMMPSPASSVKPTVPLQPSTSIQHSYSASLLQPFPPPNPPPPFTASNPTSVVPDIDRDKVRQALLSLVQDNQFVDMVHQALKKVHNT